VVLLLLEYLLIPIWPPGKAVLLINSCIEKWSIVTFIQFKRKHGSNKRKGQKELVRLDWLDMSFSFSDIEMTAEWRQYWVVYPSVVGRYYGPCTTMHEFSDSSWRILAVGRAESLPSLPAILSQSTNMTLLARAKWVPKSATCSRTSTNRTCRNSGLAFRFLI
jgi:hypothetical protein